MCLIFISAGLCISGSARLLQSSSHIPTETQVTGETSNQEEETTSQGEEPAKPVPEIVCNIGTKLSLKDYAEREWRGNTPRAELIKNVCIHILTLAMLNKLRCHAHF